MNPLLFSLAAATVAYLIKRLFFSSPLSRIPGPPNASWLTGNMGQLRASNAWSFHDYMCKTFGAVVKIRLLFSKDGLYVSDPLALHYILVKEMNNYEEIPVVRTMLKHVVGENLLSSVGQQHKRQRKMLNPLFSLKHMRDIQPTLAPVTKELTDRLVKQAQDGTVEVDMLKSMTRAALEYIGRGGLGTTFGPLDNDRATAHSEAINQLTPTLEKTMHLQAVTPFLSQFGSPAFRRKVVELLPIQDVQSVIKLSDTLYSEATSLVMRKKDAILKGKANADEEIGAGNDILSVLLKANMEASEEDRLPEEEVIGQVNLFTFAGQDTTSHALSRILDQLAHHSDAQAHLRDEVREARRVNGGRDLDYDTLNELPYLDAICRETLRCYPPALTIHRLCIQDTVLPLLWPIKATDGKTEIHEIPVKKGTPFQISIYDANRNKRIWGEDAEEWKPDRWLKPLPCSVTDARLPGVYSNMMTFVAGGRACIGFKFSEMEMKLVISSLIEKLAFAPGPKIEWQMAGLARPVVAENEKAEASLPLKMSLAPV